MWPSIGRITAGTLFELARRMCRPNQKCACRRGWPCFQEDIAAANQWDWIHSKAGGWVGANMMVLPLGHEPSWTTLVEGGYKRVRPGFPFFTIILSNPPTPLCHSNGGENQCSCGSWVTFSNAQKPLWSCQACCSPDDGSPAMMFHRVIGNSRASTSLNPLLGSHASWRRVGAFWMFHPIFVSGTSS
jgi:hypothetical protein